jgi:hypothetical protein
LLPGNQLTPTLVAGIVRLGAHLPFGQVPPLLAHFTGVQIDAETVRRLTEAAGAAAVALETEAVDAIERTLPSAPAGAAVQLLSVDGVMVPLVGGTWAEVKTLAIGTIDPAGATREPGRATQLSYFARLAEVARFSRLATVETHRRGLERATTVVAVVDGADWCQQVIDHQRSDAVRILDFAHAVGHLGAVAQALYGSGTDVASAWVHQQAHDLRHGQEATVLAELLDRATDAPTAEARQVVEQSYRYLAARAEQIHYQRFSQAGYPIGSGCVESANKLLVEARLKGSGMHWARAHVDALLARRTVEANRRWAATWPVIWARLQVQAAARARQRRRGHGRPSAPATPDPPVSDDPTPTRAPVTTERVKTIVNGKPTRDHPWRRSSPFRAKR